MRIVLVFAVAVCAGLPAQVSTQKPAAHAASKPTGQPAQQPPQKPAAPSAEQSAPKGASGTQGPAAAETPPPRVQSVQFDAGGWPIVPEDGASRRASATPPSADSPGAAPPAAPAGEGATAPTPVAKNGAKNSAKNATKNGGPVAPPLVSGMQLGSPLLDVFQATRAPGAWKEIGGLTVFWRVTTYGPGGETIGTRDITHVADTAFADRDRLEFADGRVFGRIGSQVFVERQGMPWPTLTDIATQELLLFGTHLRFPWCFADASTFVVTGRDVEERNGERSARIVLERRPPPGSEVDGPEADPKPRDRFEIYYEPSTGLPKEVVHRLAATRQTRRVQLDDWRDVEGVRMPYRRTYVDDSMHPTTKVEILRIERQRTTERDFRLH